MLPNVFLIVVSFGSKPFYLTAYLFIRERHDDKRSRTNNAPSILLYDHLLVPVLAATFTVSMPVLATTFTISVVMMSTSTAAAMTFFVLPGYL